MERRCYVCSESAPTAEEAQSAVAALGALLAALSKSPAALPEPKGDDSNDEHGERVDEGAVEHSQPARCPAAVTEHSAILAAFAQKSVAHLLRCIRDSNAADDRAITRIADEHAAKLAAALDAQHAGMPASPVVQVQYLTTTVLVNRTVKPGAVRQSLTTREREVRVGRRGMLLMLVVRDGRDAFAVPEEAEEAVAAPGGGLTLFSLRSTALKRKRANVGGDDSDVSLRCEQSSNDDNESPNADGNEHYSSFMANKARRKFRTVPAAVMALRERRDADFEATLRRAASDLLAAGDAAGSTIWRRLGCAQAAKGRATAASSARRHMRQCGGEVGVAAVFYMSVEGVLYKAFPLPPRSAVDDVAQRPARDLGAANTEAAVPPTQAIRVGGEGFVRVCLEHWRQRNQLPSAD